jgi:tRNA G10  N-methylase Trm11
MSHFCVLSATPQEEPLARAELRALCGIAGEGRLVHMPGPVAVERAAYVPVCAELLAHGAGPGEIAAQLAGRKLSFERFRITYAELPPRPQGSSKAAVNEVAQPLEGTVDMASPLTELLLVGRDGDWHFGRVVSRATRTYLAHEGKPWGFSSALPSRVSRAMVNLAAQPGETIADPCCGVGTILLEAWAAGMRAVGGDHNRKLVGMTRANLRHFGYPAWVCLADAAVPWTQGDAVVTDFPYGRQSPRAPGLYERLLGSFPDFAPRLVIVTAVRLERLLEAAGYEVQAAIGVEKRQGFERRIHVAQVR